jgi:cytochrome P450
MSMISLGQTSLTKKSKQLGAQYREYVRKMLDDRVETGKVSLEPSAGLPVFVDLAGKMLELNLKPNEGDMFIEFSALFPDGSNSLSSFLSSLVYYAASNQEQWQYGMDDPGTRTVNVVKETLRIQAPVPIVLRNLPTGHPPVKATNVEPLENQPGARVYLCPYAIMRSETSFGNDSKSFKPSRWENPTPAQLQAFIPFGRGRRACVGEALSYKVMEWVVRTLLLRKLTFSYDDDGSPKYSTMAALGASFPRSFPPITATVP